MSKHTPEYRREWRKRNPQKTKEHARRWFLKSAYGLTLEEYQQMVLERENRCDICGKTVSGEGAKDSLHVDHNHETNQRRGLICLQCNMLLGFASDNPEILQAAIEYLKRFK